MTTWYSGWVGVVALGLVGCADKAEPKYVECVKSEAMGDVIGAWGLCMDAVTADPNSKSGQAAAEKLAAMKVKYDAAVAPKAVTDDDAALARRAFVDQMNAKFVQATGTPRLRLGAAPRATTLVMLSIDDCNDASLQALMARNADGLVDTWRNKGFDRIGCDGTTGGHAEWPLGSPMNANLTPPGAVQPSSVVAIAISNDGSDAKQPILPLADQGFVDTRGGAGWGDRCWVSLKAKRYGWAKAECDQAMGMHPTSPQPRASLLFNEGLIAQQAGDIATARQNFIESLSLREHKAVRAALNSLPP